MPPCGAMIYAATENFGNMLEARDWEKNPPTNDLDYYFKAMSDYGKLHRKVLKLEEELAIAKAKSNGSTNSL